MRATFVPGYSLTGPVGLAFDSAGNLFVAADVTIYEFTPTGARTTFATVQLGANGLAFDRAGNLFVAAGYFAFFNLTQDSSMNLVRTAYEPPFRLV